MMLIELCVIPPFLLQWTNYLFTLFPYIFRVLLDRPAQMVTASRGFTLKDTKQKIRRLDSVFHHLALDEVMVPWGSDGESSSSDDQSSGFAVPYGGNTPDPVQEEKFSLDNVDFRFEEDYVNSVDLPPRLLPLFHPQETVKGYVHIVLKGLSTLVMKLPNVM